MDFGILQRLQCVTEAQEILDGQNTIDRDLYIKGQENIINNKELVEAGKLVTLRPHRRFIHFPPHTHNYVEAVYMCTGQTAHIVNGNRIVLCQGELLFVNQSATHEICRAEATDIAVNFIVLPDFFHIVLNLVGEEKTPLRQFFVECLCGQPSNDGFLHFKVSQIPTIQNLIENLLFILLQDTPRKYKMSQMTMALLFAELMGHMETLDTPDTEQATIFKVLSYVETHYAQGSLTELAQMLHFDLYALSREIKKKTGKNYTQLVQEKRLAQAAFLLKNTDRNVDDIANTVGYENRGYFHRIFKAAFDMSPKNYRLRIR